MIPGSSIGSFAAVTNSADNTVTSYAVDKTTGAFTKVDVASTGSFPGNVAFSPVVLNNLFAAVGNLVGNNVNVYNVTLPLRVISVTPADGPEKGGTTVIISGNNFANATAVHFGTAKASFEIISDTQITAVSPAGTGTADVTVTIPDDTSLISPEDQFTYTSQSAVKSNGESSAGFSSRATHLIVTPGLCLKIPLETATYQSKVARRRRDGSVKITRRGTYHLNGLLHHTSPTPVNFVDNRAQLQHCLLVNGNCVSTSIAQTEWGSPPLDNNRQRHTSHSRCTCFLKKGAIVSIEIGGSKDAGITPSQAGTSVILSIERATRSSKKR